VEKTIFSKKKRINLLIRWKGCVLKSDAIIPGYRHLGQHFLGMHQIVKVWLMVCFQEGSLLRRISHCNLFHRFVIHFYLDSSHIWVHFRISRWTRETKGLGSSTWCSKLMTPYETPYEQMANDNRWPLLLPTGQSAVVVSHGVISLRHPRVRQHMRR